VNLFLVPKVDLVQGVATRDDIDKTLKLGMNHPMGPLQLGL
jgi:3-hydroxybutyryl-CoA dehydrogenase